MNLEKYKALKILCTYENLRFQKINNLSRNKKFFFKNGFCDFNQTERFEKEKKNHFSVTLRNICFI